QVKSGKFFAMGSGPMRSAAGREPIFEHVARRQRSDAAVGVLECDRTPPAEVFADIAEKTGVSIDRVTLLAASVRSLAGGVQVVARSLETALHKLHELGFDMTR